VTSSILQIVNVSTDKLIPYANNARTHDAEQVKHIASSIKEFGFNNPIAIDSNFGVIAGHGRLAAALLLGLSEVPTISLGHLTKPQQAAYILADNRIALDAGWDNELLRLEMMNIMDAGLDPIITGFTQDEIDAIVKVEEVDLVEEDESLLLPVEDPISKLGDIWILGNHRLMCGDSTVLTLVDNLLKGEKPLLMVTDPPYGVNYDPAWRNNASLGVGRDSVGKVENDDMADWLDAYSLFPGSVAYVWHAGKFTDVVAKNLKDCGFDIVSQIIWAKNNFAISRGDYHWKHEPCWYAVKKGCNHNWQGARDQSTLWEIQSTHQVSENEKTGHGTQKPIDCMRFPILNNTRENESVYDPFGGSGTTLIACEKTNRKCFMMEISPNYCDTIVNRWQKLTGKTAILEMNGLSFEEIKNGRTQESGRSSL